MSQSPSFSSFGYNEQIYKIITDLLPLKCFKSLSTIKEPIYFLQINPLCTKMESKMNSHPLSFIEGNITHLINSTSQRNKILHFSKFPPGTHSFCKVYNQSHNEYHYYKPNLF